MDGDLTTHASAEPASPAILLVESDVLVRAPLAEYLRLCGYRVHEAGTAAEARTLLEAGRTRIDLVFASAVLSGRENGFALATWVRHHTTGINVLLTGGIANAAQRAAEVCGDGPMPTQPYSHEVVLRRIRRLLRQAEQRPPERAE